MNSEGNAILQTPQNAIFFKTCQQGNQWWWFERRLLRRPGLRWAKLEQTRQMFCVIITHQGEEGLVSTGSSNSTKTDFLCFDPAHDFKNSSTPSECLCATSLLPLLQPNLWKSPTSLQGYQSLAAAATTHTPCPKLGASDFHRRQSAIIMPVICQAKVPPHHSQGAQLSLKTCFLSHPDTNTSS